MQLLIKPLHPCRGFGHHVKVGWTDEAGKATSESLDFPKGEAGDSLPPIKVPAGRAGWFAIFCPDQLAAHDSGVHSQPIKFEHGVGGKLERANYQHAYQWRVDANTYPPPDGTIPPKPGFQPEHAPRGDADPVAQPDATAGVE